VLHCNFITQKIVIFFCYKKRQITDRILMKRCLPIANDSTSVYVYKCAVMKQMHNMCLRFILMFSFFLGTIAGIAQQTTAADASYIKVITERSAKIVNTLSITDSVKYQSVLHTLVAQYTGINSIHEKSKRDLAEIKQQNFAVDEAATKVKAVEDFKLSQLKKLHDQFLQQLQTQLNPAQVDTIKDGMTYRVFPITYTAYLDMIPTLKTEEKQKIYDWLKDARELAMDAESSDAKHAVFGKYKGRINNYLSAQGYDLTKERDAWQKRIKEKENQKQTIE
jgi:Protein of unknown function (DUF3826)